MSLCVHSHSTPLSGNEILCCMQLYKAVCISIHPLLPLSFPPSLHNSLPPSSLPPSFPPSFPPSLLPSFPPSLLHSRFLLPPSLYLLPSSSQVSPTPSSQTLVFWWCVMCWMCRCAGKWGRMGGYCVLRSDSFTFRWDGLLEYPIILPLCLSG